MDLTKREQEIYPTPGGPGAKQRTAPVTDPSLSSACCYFCEANVWKYRLVMIIKCVCTFESTALVEYPSKTARQIYELYVQVQAIDSHPIYDT